MTRINALLAAAAIAATTLAQLPQALAQDKLKLAIGQRGNWDTAISHVGEKAGIFKKHGIEVISPAVGDKFDPQHHQAMFEAPVPDTKAGDIIQVAAEGFMLHDRLLRPAQVGVSSTPAG